MPDGNRHNHLFVGKRFCEAHREKSMPDGGAYVTSKDGKRRQWICAMCLEARRIKKEIGNVQV